MARLSFAVLLALGMCACALAATVPDNSNRDKVLVNRPKTDGDDLDVNLDGDSDNTLVLDLDEVVSLFLNSAAADKDSRSFAGLGCKRAKCRTKCNKRGKNGNCIGPVCVCWS